MNKIDIKTLTSSDIKKELERRKYNHKFTSLLRSTIYILIVIAAIGGLLAMFVMPVIQISSSAMAPTYNNGDIVLTIKTKNIKVNDVIAFYYGNKILVSRVIALNGDYVDISKDGIVKVNGEVLKIDNVTLMEEEVLDREYPIEVASETYFVLNDNREIVTDSRVESVGSIKKDDLIGKIILRVYKSK